MSASEYSKAMDDIQKALVPLFKAHGFRKRGRTYNKVTPDGLTQVVNFQMGASDPPGTTYLPGVRENLHGRFTINLGVYVPEMGAAREILAKDWVSEPYCALRTRLHCDGEVDKWWDCRAEADVLNDVQRAFEAVGVPFLDRFSSRRDILAAIDVTTDRFPDILAVPRLLAAIIHLHAGEEDAARRFFAAQIAWAEAGRKSAHAQHIRDLASRLGLTL